VRSAPERSAQKRVALSSRAPLNLHSDRIAPVKSGSQRLRPRRSTPVRALNAKPARAPPGLALHSRSCLRQIASTSAWLRRAWTSVLVLLAADIDGARFE